MYLLKIAYSWGDEESDILMNSFEEAWKYAKELAINELETVCTEHECENAISFDKENGTILIHYIYDDTYCKYDIVKKLLKRR